MLSWVLGEGFGGEVGVSCLSSEGEEEAFDSSSFANLIFMFFFYCFV